MLGFVIEVIFDEEMLWGPGSYFASGPKGVTPHCCVFLMFPSAERCKRFWLFIRESIMFFLSETGTVPAFLKLQLALCLPVLNKGVISPVIFTRMLVSSVQIC